MTLRTKIIELFEAHDLFDQQGSINVDHGEGNNDLKMDNMWHSYPSTDYAMLEDDKNKTNIFVDMDNISENEFNIREKEMWGFRNKASEYGEYFLISLYVHELVLCFL